MIAKQKARAAKTKLDHALEEQCLGKKLSLVALNSIWSMILYISFISI